MGFILKLERYYILNIYGQQRGNKRRNNRDYNRGNRMFYRFASFALFVDCRKGRLKTYLIKAMIYVPSVIRAAPTAIGIVIFSRKKIAAKTIVSTKLNLSIGATFEASPS